MRLPPDVPLALQDAARRPAAGIAGIVVVAALVAKQEHDAIVEILRRELGYRGRRRYGLHNGAGRARAPDPHHLALGEICHHGSMRLIAAAAGPGAVAVVAFEQRHVMVAAAEIEHQDVAGLRRGHRRAPAEPGRRPQEPARVARAEDRCNSCFGHAIADRHSAPREIVVVHDRGAVVRHVGIGGAYETQPLQDGRIRAIARRPVRPVDLSHGGEPGRNVCHGRAPYSWRIGNQGAACGKWGRHVCTRAFSIR